VTSAAPPLDVGRLDQALQSDAAAGFSGVVLVAQGDSVLFERAYGAAAASGVAPDRLAFWIASDSKQFTATATLRLAEMGRLHVTDSLPRFLARVPHDKQAITLRQLLTHTSGLPHAYRTDGVTERDAAVNAELGLKLLAPPGAKYSYSNDGFTLLAAVVEIASGVRFDDFMHDSLFVPAGLTRTGTWGHVAATATIAPVADPRRLRGMRPTIWRGGHSVANWGYRGPTGVYSTARDLYQWIGALRSRRILGEAAVRELLGRQALVRADSTGESWTGYGWGVRVEGGRDISYGHTGSEDWLGHSSVMRFTPEGEVVIVLANSGERDGTGWASIANRTVRRVLDGAQSAR